MNEVTALVKAIQAIPSADHTPWNPRVAVETFVQHALMSIWRIQVDTKACLDPKVIAFVPLQQNAEAVPEVAAAITAYLNAVTASRPFEDVLGRVHAELLARRGEGLGQFFFPGDLLNLAQGLDTRHRPGGSGVKVYDSCCGAGSLALAAIRGRLKHTTSEKILVLAGDIDPLCAAMTALQIHANQTFHLLPLGAVKVTVGNELVGERHPGYWSHSCNYE
ncbi:SAM-dependent methyltransferase [Xanthomonas campestris]|uniref:SAM-dependent methyltransferase n=1 Tax=Xanthomonas campestris TaxID=339 RepID=UPI0020CA058B|nr:SAM-dependent methyltransferase [Xanthomonas campestris]